MSLVRGFFSSLKWRLFISHFETILTQLHSGARRVILQDKKDLAFISTLRLHLRARLKSGDWLSQSFTDRSSADSLPPSAVVHPAASAPKISSCLGQFD